MKRLGLVLVILICAVAFLAAPALAKKPKAMKIGHEMSPEHPEHLAALKFKEVFEELTDGAIEVQVYPMGQLGSFFTQMQNMQQGIQHAHINGAGFPGHFVPEFFLWNTGYGFRDFDEAEKAINGPVGMEIREKLIKDHGLRIVGAGDWRRGARNVLTKKKMVKSLADVEGLKIRVPESPAYLATWKTLGAKPTPVSFGEVYLALQQGVVEAMECPLDLIYFQKFYEVGKYISMTQHLCELVLMGVSEKFYQSLTPEQQEALEKAALEAGKYNRTLVENSENDIRKKMEDAGIVYIEVDKNEFYEKGKDAAYALEKDGVLPAGFADKARNSVR